jgi:hypothetical protein
MPVPNSTPTRAIVPAIFINLFLDITVPPIGLIIVKKEKAKAPEYHSSAIADKVLNLIYIDTYGL